LKEPAFVHSLPSLAKLAAENPFVQFEKPVIYERYISFFKASLSKKITPPIESKTKDCIVFRVVSGAALSFSRVVNGKTGYPTPLLERTLNSPVTTRSWGTIMRLVDKYA
jgi:uncharacterized protein (DUF1697 family)